MVTETDTNTGLKDETVTTSQTNTQEGEAKTFTQDEVNNMMATQKGNITRKLNQKYEELGSVEELTQLRSDADATRQAKQIKKGEFEQALKDLATKKDEQISKRDAIIQGYKVNTPLIDSAAKHRSINPEQVRDLLKGSVRLNDEGNVNVVDNKGNVRYDDNGSVLSVDTLVREFLDSNPHFVQPTKATTNTSSNITDGSAGEVDWSKQDMKDPKVRARYKKYRESSGLAQ